ncbi:MAG: ABC-2 family transporter protein [Lachnospiraceae bacterium]|nr:ABC-2 family transporter protein [Lachnospiraceae bacterium]
MSELKYYIKLYFTNMSRSMIARMEFRNDFIIGIFGFFIQNVAALLSLYFIIRNIPNLNGWNMYQMGFLYGFTMMPIAVDHLLTDELWRLAYFRVKRGDLDNYFLRPVPVLFQVLSETFQPEAFGELIVGAVMLIMCGIKCHINWTVSKVIVILVATFFGAFIVTAIKILTASPAFIIKRSGFIMQVFYNFRDYTRYPIGIYPKAIRILLIALVPFGLIISLPVENVMFENYNGLVLCIAIIAAAVVSMTIACFVWTACAKRYESTGS